LRILAAYADNELVGLLPLYIQAVPVYGRISVRLLRLVGTGGDTAPDYLGPLVDERFEEEVAKKLAEYAVSVVPGWDVLWLTDLNHGSAFWCALQDASTHQALVVSETVSAEIAIVPLPQSWEQYLESVHRDRRYTIRNTRRKFEALSDARFKVVSGAPDLAGVFDSLVRLHHRRWQARGAQHAFATPEYVGFHREAVQRCAEQGWIRFYCLEVCGEPVAVFYCYRFREEIFYFQVGFDPAFEKSRPGLVLIGFALEHAINEGNRTFDFLRGEHDYKNQWGKGLRRTYQLAGYRRNVPALLFQWKMETWPGIKQVIKRWFPFLKRRSH